MSTTMPFSSSVCAMNATSMTKVAPCSACAGPNTAPRNEWAIITWSRPSTVNTKRTSVAGIGNELAEYAALRAQDVREPLREFVERYGGHQQGVEPWVGQKLDRLLQPLPMRRGNAARWRHLAHLARHDLEAAAVKGAAQRHRHAARAVPAHFQDSRFVARDVERSGKAARIGAGVHDQFVVDRRIDRCREIQAERARKLCPRRIDVDQGHLRAALPRAQESDQCTDHACADHRD